MSYYPNNFGKMTNHANIVMEKARQALLRAEKANKKAQHATTSADDLIARRMLINGKKYKDSLTIQNNYTRASADKYFTDEFKYKTERY